MRSLFYLFMALLVITMFFPEVGNSAQELLLKLLDLANTQLAQAAA